MEKDNHDIHHLRMRLIELGVDPDSKPVQKRVQTATDDTLSNFNTASNEHGHRFYAAMTRARDFIFRLLAYMVVLIIGALIALGIPAVIVAVLYAEYQAVKTGIETITSYNAGLYSIAALVLFLIVLFIINLLHDTEDDDTIRKYIPSLRMFWKRVVYFWGWGKSWQAKEESQQGNLHIAYVVIRWLSIASMMFSVLGRIAPKLDALPPDVWYRQILAIVTQTTLMELMQYIGVAVLTYALLLGSHLLIFLVYYLFKQITGGFSFGRGAAFLSLEDAKIQAQIMIYQEIIAIQERKQKSLPSTNKP